MVKGVVGRSLKFGMFFVLLLLSIVILSDNTTANPDCETEVAVTNLIITNEHVASTAIYSPSYHPLTIVSLPSDVLFHNDALFSDMRTEQTQKVLIVAISSNQNEEEEVRLQYSPPFSWAGYLTIEQYVSSNAPNPEFFEVNTIYTVLNSNDEGTIEYHESLGKIAQVNKI